MGFTPVLGAYAWLATTGGHAAAAATGTAAVVLVVVVLVPFVVPLLRHLGLLRGA
jgi:hypothetical protein